MNRKRIYNNISGTVLVELTIIFPIILLITLTGFEFTRAIKFLKISTSFSKEMANLAIRDCSDSTTRRTCLDEKRENLEKFAQTVVPEMEIMISYIEYDTDSEKNGAGSGIWVNGYTLRSLDDVGNPSTNNTSNFSTFVASNKWNTYVNKLKNHLRPWKINIWVYDGGELYFAECFVPYDPLFGFVTKILPFGGNNGYIYDATII